MTTSKTMVPSLRFPSFTDSWKAMKLGGAIKSIDAGWSPQCAAEPASAGEWGILKTTSVSWDGYNDQANKRLLDGRAPRDEIEVKAGDILVTRAGPSERVGVVAYVNRTRPMLMLSDKIIRLRCNDENDGNFLARCLGSSGVQGHLLGRKSGLAKSQTNISQKDLMGTDLRIPALPEQRKIADFLTAVDGRLQQLSQKRALLQDYKKGVMQQLLTQALRFKDDHGNDFPEWEEKKANEVFARHSNKKHSSDLPILSASQEHGMVPREENGIQIQATAQSVASYKVVEAGDFVISLRSFQGGIEYSSFTGICSPAYTILKSSLPIDGHFYRHYFKTESFIERLSNTVVGIRDGKQISYEPFGTLLIPFPTVPEQTKIANFLTALDRKIEDVSSQITYTQSFKKGLLQQMFV